MEKCVENYVFSELRRRKTLSDNNDSESSSDEEIIIHVLKRRGVKHKRISDFVENVAFYYSISEFQKHFRISKAAFQELLDTLHSNNVIPGRPPYPLKHGLLMTIWALATQETFREIGDRFNLNEGHAYRIFIKFCIKLTNQYKKYIVWPTNEMARKNLEGFNKLRGEWSFKNVFGCIDGTHIAIPGPSDDNSYYNRKGFHSIQMQAICNSKGQFINVYCGWPGSVHDARVLQASQVYNTLEENPLSLLLPNTYLLGDCAYPLKKYLMVPFKDNGLLTRRQRRFNAKLSSTRVLIEQSFGRLKGLFRRLKFLNILKLENAKFVIIAACVLCNISIEDGIDFNEEIDAVENHARDDIDLGDAEEDFQIARDAVALRNNILNEITM